MKKISTTMSLLLATVLSPFAMADVPNPDPVDLGVLPLANHDTSRPFAINASGQIVGVSYYNLEGIYVPFVWQKGVMTQLPMPSGYEQGYALSINASGLIAGVFQANSGYKSCVWTPTKKGGWTANLLTPPAPYDYSMATKVNDAGQVLMLLGSSTAPAIAAIWQSGNWTYITSGTDLDDIQGLPTQMNNNGQVLVYTANAEGYDQDLWVWDAGVAKKAMEHVDFANFNDLGKVVGSRHNRTTSQFEPFTYDIATDVLTIYSLNYSLANINNNGKIVVANNNVSPVDVGATLFTDVTAVDMMGSVNANLLVLPNLQINANDEVGGCGNTPGTAFYASSATGVVPLNNLVQPTNMDASDFMVIAMNDSGMIIGQSDHRAVLWCAGPSVGTVTAARKGKSVTFTVPIKNMNSVATAYNVAVTDITMDGGTLVTSLPTIRSINPGQTAIATFRFSSNTGSGELKMTGTSSLGAFSTTQTVTVP